MSLDFGCGLWRRRLAGESGTRGAESGVGEKVCVRDVEPGTKLPARGEDKTAESGAGLRVFGQSPAKLNAIALAYLYLVPAYERKGMFEEAVEELQKAITLSGSSTPLVALLGYVYAVSGRSDKTDEMLGELKERAKEGYVPPYYFALIYAGLDQKGQAFEWLEKAYDERSSFLVWLNVDPVFDNLRSDPRFTDLLRRIGLRQ